MFRLGLLRNRLKKRFEKPLEPDSEEAKSEAALLAAGAFGIATVLTLSTAGMVALVVGKACGVSNVSFLPTSPLTRNEKLYEFGQWCELEIPKRVPWVRKAVYGEGGKNEERLRKEEEELREYFKKE